MKKFIALVVVLISAITLASCTSNESSSSSVSLTEKKGQIVQAFLAYMTSADGKADIKSGEGIIATSSSDKEWDSIKADYPICKEDNSDIVIKLGGSTSVKHVVEALIASFEPLCGNVDFQYAGTGSSDGYKRTQGSEADGANALDIGFASREFKDSESGPAASFGYLATDAIVAVVNAKNTTLSNVTADDLKKIYEVGSSTTLNVYTRDTASGTRDGFFSKIGLEEAVKDDSKLISNIQVVSSNGDMVSKVKADDNGIGYISLSSLEGSGLKALSYNGVEASEANVVNSTYTLSRHFNWVIRAEYILK